MTEAQQRHDEQAMTDLLAGLTTEGPPRLAFARRASAGISGRPGNLLCLSASFNPLTVAHVRLVQEACRIIPPDEVLFLLAKTNVDKTASGLPLERRLSLLVGYTESRSEYSVAACTHGRFVDKAEAVRAQYPRGTELAFLVGFDTLVRLFDPKYYTDRATALSALFSTSTFVAANRAPASPETVAVFLDRPEVTPYAHRIRLLRLPPEIAAISATEVRTRLACGTSIADLVPPEILPFLRP